MIKEKFNSEKEIGTNLIVILLVLTIISAFFVYNSLSELESKSESLQGDIEHLEEKQDNINTSLSRLNDNFQKAQNSYVKYCKQYDYLKQEVSNWSWFLEENEYPENLMGEF